MAKKTSALARSNSTPTRAKAADAPAHLTSAERVLFGEAIRRGEDLREEIQTSMSSYGRWLLGAIFKDDSTAALDKKSKNPVWLELLRRAGGPTLGISKTALYVAVRIAALDQRIGDQAWRGLDAGRKALLLPLGTDDQRATDRRLREAAQHVSKFNLSWSNTTKYVTQLLSEEGDKPRSVRLTMGRLTSRMQDFRKTFGSAKVLRRVNEMRSAAAPEEREAAAIEIEALRETLSKLVKALRTKA